VEEHLARGGGRPRGPWMSTSRAAENDLADRGGVPRVSSVWTESGWRSTSRRVEEHLADGGEVPREALPQFSTLIQKVRALPQNRFAAS
jgi:hypothetical protein